MEFEKVYTAYFKSVYHYIWQLSGSEQLAEELTSETFFKAMGAIDRFRGDCDLRVWLCRGAGGPEGRNQSRDRGPGASGGPGRPGGKFHAERLQKVSQKSLPHRRRHGRRFSSALHSAALLPGLSTPGHRAHDPGRLLQF